MESGQICSLWGCRVRPCVSRHSPSRPSTRRQGTSSFRTALEGRQQNWLLEAPTIRGTHAYQKEPSRVPPRSSCIQRKEKDHGEADRDGRNRRYSTRVNPGDAAALREAERRFKELTGAGFIAAVRSSVGQSEFTRNYDPAAEECILPPA